MSKDKSLEAQRERRRQERKQPPFGKQVHRVKMTCDKSGKSEDWYKEYKDYLKSPEWAEIRLEVISQRKRCERCESTSNLQVHHLTYKNLFNENPEDLELLCKRCHDIEHGKKPKDKKYRQSQIIRDLKKENKELKKEIRRLKHNKQAKREQQRIKGLIP